MCPVKWSFLDRDPEEGLNIQLHNIFDRFSVSRVLFFLHAPLIFATTITQDSEGICICWQKEIQNPFPFIVHLNIGDL